MSRNVVLFGPLALQQCLSPAIAFLLLPIRLDGITTMMPDQSRGMKTNRPAVLLQPPADVDIIPSRTKLRVETTNGLERGSPKRHVTPGNVLGFMVREHDM